ncbi:DUF562 domain-containing protein [Candidatus Chlamydia corallus]|uniref:DUF562 domain-containing protein n=1 Tax=Candidatus Chlamydia corallus TaxID=2038470 RepID=UPI001EFD671D|nr:DUF562 domain-containing protein [Candidatus Chlamydia corallus]
MDSERVYAPLSQEYYCHSYLAELENDELRDSVLSAFLDPGNIASPDLQPVSVNVVSGVSEISIRFLCAVSSTHPEKNVLTIFCNYPETPNWDEVERESWIRRAKSKGYSYLNIFSYGSKGLNVDTQEILSNNTSGKSFTILLFEDPVSAADVRCLQLASEGICVSRMEEASDIYAAGCSFFAIKEAGWCVQKSHCNDCQYDPEIGEAPDNLTSRKEKHVTRLDEIIMSQPSRDLLRREHRDCIYACNTIAAEHNFLFSLDSAIRQALWNWKDPELRSLALEIKNKFFSLLEDPDFSAVSGPRLGSIKFRRLYSALQARAPKPFK